MRRPTPNEFEELRGVGWNDLSLDEQEVVGHTIHEASKLHPGWLNQEELDSIARFVRFTQQRKADHGSTEEETYNDRE